jgi:hypothetical protein
MPVDCVVKGLVKATSDCAGNSVKKSDIRVRKIFRQGRTGCLTVSRNENGNRSPAVSVPPGPNQKLKTAVG